MASRRVSCQVIALSLLAVIGAGCGSVMPPATPSSSDANVGLPLATTAPLPSGLDSSGRSDASPSPGPASSLGDSGQAGGLPPALDWPVPDPRARGSGAVYHVPILLYHRIVDSAVVPCGRPGLCVAPATFSAQLGRLAAAGWRTITMATFAADLATGTLPRPRTFVITIDDGYGDGLTNGLPILRRYGFVATYYVVTGRLGHRGELQAADLVTLAAAGMEIGDHTLSHVNLDRLPPIGVAFQVRFAAQMIESVVGEVPATFAYPFGDRNRAVISAVAGAGFGAAVIPRDTGIEDWANRFQLPRIEVGPNATPDDMLARLTAFASHGILRRHPSTG